MVGLGKLHKDAWVVLPSQRNVMANKDQNNGESHKQENPSIYSHLSVPLTWIRSEPKGRLVTLQSCVFRHHTLIVAPLTSSLCEIQMHPGILLP